MEHDNGVPMGHISLGEDNWRRYNVFYLGSNTFFQFFETRVIDHHLEDEY